MNFTTESKARKESGLSYIGNINSSAKIIKNMKVSGNYTYVIYLAPANQSGFNVCPFSTPECRLGCLATSGRAAMDIISGHNVVANCRNKKTQLFFHEQDFFMDWMMAEMKRYQKKAYKDNFAFSVRLNGTSDINWKTIYRNGKNIFEHFPEVQFYDYTKDAEKAYNNNVPNYHLTFSYTGKNINAAKALIEKGKNIAVVFDINKKQPLPATWKGFNVIDGDITDYRLDDGEGVIVALHWKRIANKEVEKQILNSPFVVKANDLDCQY